VLAANRLAGEESQLDEKKWFIDISKLTLYVSGENFVHLQEH
jgi:hypothetical protein